MLNRVGPWLRAVLLRRRIEREMQEEMASHLEHATERLIARGLSPRDARRQAVREFGNVAFLQDQARDARGTAWLDAVVADLRFALRHFTRTPATTIIMLVVLAGGMGISTLLFTYVRSYAVQPPLGVERRDDLVRIRGSQDAGVYGRTYRPLGEEEFRAYRRLTDQFAGVAGWTDASVALDAASDPERRGLEARATFVTENWFSVLGVRTVIGAGLPTTPEAAAAPIAVISYNTWEQLFARDPSAIGAVVDVNGQPVTIVGVAPERFNGMGGYRRFELWLPLEVRDMLMADVPPLYRVVARLHGGVTHDAATAAVQAVAANTIEHDEGASVHEPSTEVVPLLAANGDPMFERDVRLMSFFVGLLGLLVLLVACTNVSALLTGLATRRRHEIAVRLSLGAARGRILRQLLTESALLAMVAAVVALGIVTAVLHAVRTYVLFLPLDLSLDWAVTAFTFGTALAVGMLFGVSPALHATRLAVASALRDSAGIVAASRARLQRALVVAQIAFTQPLTVLLAAVLLLVVAQLQPASRSPVADRVIAMSTRQAFSATLDSAAIAEAVARQRQTMRALHERVQSVPGVEATSIVWGGRLSLGQYAVHREDRVAAGRQDKLELSAYRTAEGYFPLMGIPVVRGREFSRDDVLASATAVGELPAIVDVELARQLWPGADPIGRRLQPAGDSTTLARTLVIVGVVDDPVAETRAPGEPHWVHVPVDTAAAPSALMIRTAGAAQLLMPTIRRIIQGEAPGTIVELRTVAQIQDEHERNYRLAASGVSAAGLIALGLSAIGLYAVVAFSVAQRTREIAVRMAVGGGRRRIAARFLVDGLRLSGIGLALGLPLSVLGLRLLMIDADVPRVPLPMVTAIAALGVLLVAAAAAWIPARRAASVDPAVTLRAE